MKIKAAAFLFEKMEFRGGINCTLFGERGGN